MYAFSTAVFVSILALASSLAVVVQAGDPRLIKCLDTEPIPRRVHTCDDLLSSLNTDKPYLIRMNPGLNCDQILKSGQVCVQGQFPTCLTTATAGGKHTMCDDLATAYHITTAQFIAYNDDVNAKDCSGVVPGHTYCVAVEG